VRAQDWFLLPADEVAPLAPAAATSLCYHLGHRREGGRLTKMMDCKLSHWDSESTCSRCGGPQQCHYCHTEFQLDVKAFREGGVALVITSWLDLGDCRTPLNPKWARRMYPPTYELRKAWEQDGVSFKPGSIRDLFEDGSAFLFDSFLKPDCERELLQSKVCVTCTVQ
jgi:hypothetical protein